MKSWIFIYLHKMFTGYLMIALVWDSFISVGVLYKQDISFGVFYSYYIKIICRNKIKNLNKENIYVYVQCTYK